ncbi:MAG: pyrophosphatase [Euryarchaeota archaeon]|nr:pyrophosphatase [Euryarchaeota archaeon]|tara:strand:- start:4814 stop:5164 length:351 start_codon:yes stop_codon:yes gene_type:complete
MSQSFAQMLEKVEDFHKKHNFASEENNGHDMSYRILLTIEELGELAECFTKGKSKAEKAEELADILILIFGHAIAMDVNLEEAFNKKMETIMKRPAIIGDFGIRITDYEKKNSANP